MIRAIRPSAMAKDDATMISGWNIAPNLAYVVRLLPGASSCGVLLYDEDNSLIATGAALAGTDQPCVLTPQAGQTVEMVDADMGWHLLLTTVGTESQREVRIGPAVDLPDEIHPVYGDDDMALARATAAIDQAAHYIDDVTVTCPLGLGAGLGDGVSVPVDGAAVVGQVESITWTAAPDSVAEQAVIRRHVAIAPLAYAEPEPIVLPSVVDDDAEATHATGTSGNILANDDSGLTVTAVNGFIAMVGEDVAGSEGGVFVVNADGSWTFDPDDDFNTLTGGDYVDTVVTYHASDGASEDWANLTVRVTVEGYVPDEMWDDVELLIQAPSSGSVIADAIGHTVTPQGDVSISTALGYPTIYFDGFSDWLDVDSIGDFNFLHGATTWTLEYIYRPSVLAGALLDTNRNNAANAGAYLAFGATSCPVKITLGSNKNIVNGSITHGMSVNNTYHIAFVYNQPEATQTNTVILFVDGVYKGKLGRTTHAPSTANSLLLQLGLGLNGHVSAIRITRGIRYPGTTTFTPPTWPLASA